MSRQYVSEHSTVQKIYITKEYNFAYVFHFVEILAKTKNSIINSAESNI